MAGFEPGILSFAMFVMYFATGLADENMQSYLSLSVNSFQVYTKLLVDLISPVSGHTVTKRQVSSIAILNETDTTIALLNNATDYTMSPADNDTTDGIDLFNNNATDIDKVVQTVSPLLSTMSWISTIRLNSSESTSTSTSTPMMSSTIISTKTSNNPDTTTLATTTVNTTKATVTSVPTTTPSSTVSYSASIPQSSATTVTNDEAIDEQVDANHNRYDGRLREKNKSRWRMQDHCQRLSQDELVEQLKERGTYNPDLMAWDVPGVIRFLEKTTVDTYDVDKDDLKKKSAQDDASSAVENNLKALERILNELNVPCDVRSPEVIEKMRHLTAKSKKDQLINFHRAKRETEDLKSGFDYYYARNKYLRNLYEYHSSFSNDEGDQSIVVDTDEQLMQSTTTSTQSPSSMSYPSSTTTTQVPSTTSNMENKQENEHKKTDDMLEDDDQSENIERLNSDDIIGTVHVVPFGCQKRGSREDGGYLRLCGVCQAIRRLPDNFFPPFINEVLCDQDKACLYFYDYPHGKCKQKHMNFVVLKNVGTPECQIWRKFNINVRVCCECFVDEMSFFSKYV